MRSHRVGECQAGEVHDAVRRGHEEGQVVQPVAVDAPDERAGHLPDGRERDDGERLRAPFRGDPCQRGAEHGEGQDAESELLRVGREVIEGEQAGQVGPAGYCRNCSSCHEGTGASSSSGRPPPPGCW